MPAARGARVRPERDRGLRNPVAGALAAELRIDQVSGVASRPAGVGAVDHLVDGLRRQVVARASRAPCWWPTRGRSSDRPTGPPRSEAGHVDPARTTLGRHEVDRRSPRIGFDAHVAGRPGREEQLPVRQHGDRPVECPPVVRPSSTTDRSASRRSPSSPRRKSRVSPATSRLPSGSKATECADSKPRPTSIASSARPSASRSGRATTRSAPRSATNSTPSAEMSMNRGMRGLRRRPRPRIRRGRRALARPPDPMSTLTPIARCTTGRRTTTSASAVNDATIANRPRLRIRLTRFPFVSRVIVPAED